MNIFCAGLNHRIASLNVRECAAVDDHSMEVMLERVRAIDGVSGAVMLSTCNRVELYASTLCPLKTLYGFQELLQERSGKVLPLYHHITPAAARHLFRVASGLDSMVLGETEIFGQVKKAYALAAEYGSITSPLHRLFQHAFRVAKSVRTDTQITRGAVSVGSVAVELAEKIFGKLEQCRVMILGAGEISERTARSLQARGVRSVIVSNRTYDHAATLAAEIGGMALHFDHWEKTVNDVDIIISATGAPHAILTVEKLQPLLKQRQQRPLFVIDLAVPRDAEPEINRLQGVFLYDIDNLQQIAAQSLDLRRQEVVRCESMIEEHVGTFLKWWRGKNSFSNRLTTKSIFLQKFESTLFQPVILGTRGSALARVQTGLVCESLHTVNPQLLLEQKIITTTGDAKPALAIDEPVAEGLGLFTRQLEEALLVHQIDAAVHSLKDLPVVTPAGLTLAAILPRANVADVLITRRAGGLKGLSSGAIVSTSSPRRLEWVRAHRADLVVKPIRGNVLTRLRKLVLQQEEYRIDALLLSRAGLERLGLDLGITNGQGGFLFEEMELFVTELSDLLPAPGQGAIAVETRMEKNSLAFEEALQQIHHAETARCVTAERLLLYYLGGGCHMALGALATIDPSSQQLYLRASYVPFAAAKSREGEATGATPEEVALRVATQLGDKLA